MMEVPAPSVSEQQSDSAGAEVTSSSNLVSTGPGSGESVNAAAVSATTESSSEASATQLHGEVSTVGTGETSQTHTLLSTNAVQGTVFNGGTMYVVCLHIYIGKEPVNMSGNIVFCLLL